MRTKALLAAAAFAAGLATSLAQNVYSLNVVGYYNVTVPANSFALIANQLNTTNNTIGSLLPSVPPGTQLFKYGPGGWVAYTFDEFDLVWTPDGNATLNPGEGAFIKNNTSQPLTVTFVGEVPQGQLVNPIPAGYSVRSSIVPQAGALPDLNFPAQPGDQVFKYTPGTGYTSYTFDEFDLVWTPSNPQVNVGEAFFSRKNAAVDWVRNFTVQ